MIKFKVKVMLAMREMTQKELAEKTGIRPPTISAICLGTIKHLPVDALDKICEACLRKGHTLCIPKGIQIVGGSISLPFPAVPRGRQ